MAPFLSPDVDVVILECCGAIELGRCASASQGRRAAAAVAWKVVATRKFPLLISIARAESQLPTAKPFDYASAFFCQLHLRVSRPRLDDLEELEELEEMDTEALSRIIVTYELCTRKMGKRDVEYEPYFVWSGRMSTLSPELWTSEQVPTELQRWWDETLPELGVARSATGFRYSGSGPAKKPALRIYVTAASKTLLLYNGKLKIAYEGQGPLTSPTLYFRPEVAPGSPRFAEPPEGCSMRREDVPVECGMKIHPILDIPTGRLRLESYMPDDVEGHEDVVVCYVSNLDIDWLADPPSDYRGEDGDDY